MYSDRLKDLIGKQCVCCESFIPVSGTDEYGHKIEFVTNNLGLCNDCFVAFKSVVGKEREATQKKNYF